MPRAVISAVAAALITAACAEHRSAPAGALTSKDLGPGWLFIGTNPHPTLDLECESIAFNSQDAHRVVPAHVLATSYTRGADAKPGEITGVTEYVMRFGSTEQAAQALRAYAEIADECAVGGDIAVADDDEHVVRNTDRNVLSRRTLAGFIRSPDGTTSDLQPYWLDFVIDGDRAVWLLIQGGTEQDVAVLATKAMTRARADTA